jgi:hypothetical protein
MKNWGWGGLPVAEYRKNLAKASGAAPPRGFSRGEEAAEEESCRARPV